jgi:hypothetical protein
MLLPEKGRCVGKVVLVPVLVRDLRLLLTAAADAHVYAGTDKK